MNHHRSMTLAHPRREPQLPQLPPQRSWLARLHRTMCILVLLRALAALLTGHASRALVHAVAPRGGEGSAIVALARTEGALAPACYCYPLAGCGAALAAACGYVCVCVVMGRA
ncbi:hypothetical protein F5X96DRAFT_673062 [Biscogniauxia mediterranea]|nr:hypothetical protein F5X96DRAFT_673062 [Biscogniauxia mediterranea]